MSDAGQQKNAAPALFSYFILGMAFLVVALVIRAPASAASRLFPAQWLSQVSAWGGTLWQGQVVLSGAEPVLLEWQVKPWYALTGKIHSHLDVKGASQQVTGDAVLTVGGWRLQKIQGDIPSALVQRLLPAGWELPGSVNASQLNVAHAGFQKGSWTEASGQMHWQGGAMHFSVNGQEQQAVLPPLTVQLQKSGDALVLLLEEAQGQLATLHLSADGVLETQLRERLLRYSPSYHGSGADPDTVVVTTRQSLSGQKK